MKKTEKISWPLWLKISWPYVGRRKACKMLNIIKIKSWSIYHSGEEATWVCMINWQISEIEQRFSLQMPQNLCAFFTSNMLSIRNIWICELIIMSQLYWFKVIFIRMPLYSLIFWCGDLKGRKWTALAVHIYLTTSLVALFNNAQPHVPPSSPF